MQKRPNNGDYEIAYGFVANGFCSGRKERKTDIMRLHMLLLKAEIEEATLARKVRLQMVLL